LSKKKEIRLTIAFDSMLQVNQLENVTIEIDNYKKREIERVNLKWNAFSKLLHLSRSYASLYKAYAIDVVEKYANFNYALKRHV